MSLTHYLLDKVRPASCPKYHSEMRYQFSNAFHVLGILLRAGDFKLLLITLNSDLSYHLELVLCTRHGLCPLHF